MTGLTVGQLDKRAHSGTLAYRVEIVRDWSVAISRWSGDFGGTGFQSCRWLDAWYRAFDGVTPLIALITDAATERHVALVPLVHRVQGGIRRIEFADLGLTDYNAPLLGAGAPTDPVAARGVCRALIAALRKLPEGADLRRMQKMPAEIDGKPNPLIALGRVGSCSLNGNLIEVGDDLDAYRASIKKMQLPRSWRLFSRYPGASFEIVDRVDDALRLLDTMDVQQQARMHALGLEFSLNQGPRAEFYRDLVTRSLRDGYAVVSVLKCTEAVVATVFGIRQGRNFVFLRISNAGRRWSHCSPSRLIVERTMAALHQDGVREFDLSIGNYAFKRRFGATPLPLSDVSVALGWRGHPWLAEKVSRALGKLSRDEE